MMITFVTCIYSNLYGTKFGGRPGRDTHYKQSLVSLSQMKDCNFIVYTSKEEYSNLKDFLSFDERFTVKIEDLENFRYHKEFLLKKDSNTELDRCFEIEYFKLKWLKDGIENSNANYIFWIDAGLSYSGLIPDRYLLNSNGIEKYYQSFLFNDKFLNNIIKLTDSKLFCILKENSKHHWSRTLPERYYNVYNSSYHMIAGLFGGKSENVKWLCDEFEKLTNIVVETEEILFHEEQLLTCIYHNNLEKFIEFKFDIWWHENSQIPGIESMLDYCKDRKSFYKVLEELNK